MVLASDDKHVKNQVADSFIHLIKSNAQNPNEEQRQQEIELQTKLVILFSLIA